MTTTIHFPWAVLGVPIALSLRVEEPADAEVDDDARLVLLDPTWSQLSFVVRTSPLADRLRELTSRFRVVMELHAPEAKLRRSVRASMQADGSFEARATLWREEASGRLEVTVSAVDDTDPGRFVGCSNVWKFWLDERPPFRGDISRGPFPVRWVDFSDPVGSGLSPLACERLSSNPLSLWFLDTLTTMPPYLLLNRSSTGFRELMNSTKGGRIGALRDLVGLQIATELIRDLAVRALAEVSVDDDHEIIEPADPLLTAVLGQLIDWLEITDGDRSDFLRRAVAAFETGGAPLAKLTADVTAVVTSGYGHATSLDRVWKLVGHD